MKDTIISNSIFDEKRLFFDAGETQSYAFRIEQLKNLKAELKVREKKVLKALHEDLHKPVFEAFSSEVGMVYAEINFTLKHLRKWMRPKRVSTPLVLEASKSKIIKEPKGVVLILGPWNYPFQLLIAPLIGAIAAGNCIVLKPSDETPKTAHVIEEIINNVFPENYISVIQGEGSVVGSELLKRFSWNHVFFTGSPGVGKKIAELAAAHLSPVTLELGGKSPAIVDKQVNIDIAAKRIVFGKFFNAGQTCVSPDYILIHESIKEQFVDRLKHYISGFYGSNPIESKHLAHIVNRRRFKTLQSYLSQGEIIIGGKSDKEKLAIEPTVIDKVSLDSPIMQEEIFGPILPIIEWKKKSQLIDIIRRNRYPLACYVFTKNTMFENFVIEKIEFGGGGVNNTLVHLMNPKLPFGGVGSSGVGSYHGKYSFDVFSHEKAILKTKTFIDLPLRYAPYKGKDLKMLKRFFK